MNTLSELTPMERRVLELLAENKTSKEIASELFISFRTVQNHRQNIAYKLNLKGSNKLLQFAIENKEKLRNFETSGMKPVETLGYKRPNVSTKSLFFLGVSVLILVAITLFTWLQKTSTHDESMADKTMLPGQRSIKNRIAVLPFSNISEDPADEFISDGITEELITTLSKLDPLRVIARTSVMKYKKNPMGILEIGNELKVGTILEGSVRKSGNKLRVSAQLIDAQSEEHLWAQDYDRELDDIFAIQSDIAQRVTEALRMELLVNTSDVDIGSGPAPNREAHTHYLKGRYFWNKRNNQAFRTAIEYFKKSIEIDSAYAKAYVGLADSYLQLGEWGFIPALEAFSLVKQNVAKALELDPGLGEAHCTMAVANHALAWEWKRAELEFQTAIELNPGYATARQWYAEYLSIIGRHDEALAEIQKARELDPLSLVIEAVTGWLLYCASEYEQAIEQLLKTSKMDSNFVLTDIYLGRAYIGNSMFHEALSVLLRAREKFPDNSTVLAALGYAYAVSGEREKAEKVIRELDHAAEQHYALSNFKALIYAGLREKDLAIHWLEKTYEEHVAWLSWVNVDPSYDHLRKEPEFIALLEKMALLNLRTVGL